MNKILLRLLYFLIGVVSASAGSFDEANARFKSGDFAGAAAAYEKILDAEGPRASVYYNLGNSYQQLKQYGPAILAYERARLLTPRDPDLLANLALARKAAASYEGNSVGSLLRGVFDEVDQRLATPATAGLKPWFYAVIRHFSRNEWSWCVAGSAITVGSIALLRGMVRLRAGWMRKSTEGMAILAGIVLLFGSYVLFIRSGEALLGIVLTEKSVVRLSPFEKAESLGSADPGRIVRLGAKSGGFQFVEVPGADLKGWLADKDVEAITR